VNLRELKEEKLRRLKVKNASVDEDREVGSRMSAADTITGQMKNVPASAATLLKDLTYPVRHPVDFSNSVTNLGKGVYQKFTDGVQPQERHVDEMVDYAKERFGGMDNIARTAYTDPLGLAADAAGLLALRPLARAAMQPKKMTKAASDLWDRKVYRDTSPVDEYREVVKGSFEQKNLDKNIRTALDEKLEPTSEGVAFKESLIDDIDSSIAKLIQESTSRGNKVRLESVFSEIEALKAKLGTSMNSDGLGNLGKIDETVAKITDAAAAEGRHYYTVADLQELKRNLYLDAKYDVVQSKADSAVNKTRKNIAHNAKKQIEGHVSSIQGLNNRYGNLIDIDKSLTRAARRIEGLNPVGIGSPINLLAGTAAVRRYHLWAWGLLYGTLTGKHQNGRQKEQSESTMLRRAVLKTT